jgi:hypothetical protein
MYVVIYSDHQALCIVCDIQMEMCCDGVPDFIDLYVKLGRQSRTFRSGSKTRYVIRAPGVFIWRIRQKLWEVGLRGTRNPM